MSTNNKCRPVLTMQGETDGMWYFVFRMNDAASVDMARYTDVDVWKNTGIIDTDESATVWELASIIGTVQNSIGSELRALQAKAAQSKNDERKQKNARKQA
jgi:hypothetical protein